MPSIFEKYQLKQVINASGRMTALGVSTPRPEVIDRNESVFRDERSGE